MRSPIDTLDIRNLARTAIGFDRLFKTLESISADVQSTYPAYDIIRVGDNEYRIDLAVAGFSKDEIAIDVENGVLTVRGEHKESGKDTTYIHRGIARREFVRRFSLDEYIEVKGARLDGGLLSLDLARHVPEAKRPRRIEIGFDTAEAAAA